MKKNEMHENSLVDGAGMLSIPFIKQLDFKVRVLAGAPTLLEIGVISAGLRSRSDKATVSLFDDNGSIVRSYKVSPTVSALVELMHEKFSKTALVSSDSDSEVAYFDYSDDYFIYLQRSPEIDNVFHLDRHQMTDYFLDSIEGTSDEHYLRKVFSKYEPFM